MLHFIPCELACLAIASLYYTWRAVERCRRKPKNLHDRIAYMLWVIATHSK
jgi:hypothetical protein